MCRLIKHFSIFLQNTHNRHSISHSCISMGWCKKDATLLLTDWSYVFLALSHQYELYSVYYEFKLQSMFYHSNGCGKYNIVLSHHCCEKCIDDLVQDCSNSIANALELLQSCTKPSACFYIKLCYSETNTQLYPAHDCRWAARRYGSESGES